MPTKRDPRLPTNLLRAAIVLGTTEEACTVVDEERSTLVRYALLFPSPRMERVAPGHLVAIGTAADGSDVVIWRWFDAVVIAAADGIITCWEPAHGSVVAQARDPETTYRPGSRVYLSAGLPGAEWWGAGPVVDRAEDADVELDEVHDFFTSHSLWDRLT